MLKESSNKGRVDSEPLDTNHPKTSEVTEDFSSGIGIFVLGSCSWRSSVAVGGMAAFRPNRIGCYASFRSDFSNVVSEYIVFNPSASGSGNQFWSSGKISHETLTAVAGGVCNIGFKWLNVYLGAGYGKENEFWQDYKGKWAKISSESRSGLAVDGGLLCQYPLSGRFSLAASVGLTSVKFNFPALTVGVGISF